MKRFRTNMGRLGCLILAVALFEAFAVAALGDSREAGRLAMGVKLFRATLAADLAISEKASPDGSLELLIYSGADVDRARDLADKLADGGPIRGMPVRIRVSHDPTLSRYRERPPAGIFIADADLSEPDLATLVAFGRKHHVIVYSPFEGHVEQGVTAGLFITARVRPYVNVKSLAASEIRMKAFFLKVAKLYR